MKRISNISSIRLHASEDIHIAVSHTPSRKYHSVWMKGRASDWARFRGDERWAVRVNGIKRGAVDVEDCEVVVVCAAISERKECQQTINEENLSSRKALKIKGYARSKDWRMLMHAQRP